jgi:hypothetical protein
MQCWHSGVVTITILIKAQKALNLFGSQNVRKVKVVRL